MKCSTCQKPTTATIDGRMFCSDCGSKAAQRLQNFQPQKQSYNQENILDLNQPKQSPEEANKPISPIKSLHGTHAKNFHANTSAASSGPKQQPGTSLSGTNNSARHNARFNERIINPLPQSQDPQPPQQESERVEEPAIQQEAAPMQATTQPESILGELEQQETAQVTHMEPHQTYSLKEEAQQQEQPFSQYLANYSMSNNNENQPDAFQPQKKKKKWLPWQWFNSMALRAGTVGLCILLLGGYVTYLNYPHIAVRVAAGQADIDASLPEYTPEGYKFRGPVTYGPNQLTVTFGSSDDSNISVTQKSTNWDSESLLENHVRYQTSRYDTYREDGLVIYTYDNRYATWVNGGMMYEIESSNSLDEEEIVRMAGSL